MRGWLRFWAPAVRFFGSALAVETELTSRRRSRYLVRQVGDGFAQVDSDVVGSTLRRRQSPMIASTAQVASSTMNPYCRSWTAV